MMNDLLAILPLLVVIGSALVLLLVDLLIPVGKKWLTALLTALCLAVALGPDAPATG